MADPTLTTPAGVRFGRTFISVHVGELVEQPVEAIIAPGNKRAMFAAGPSGTLWNAAGEAVERELRKHAPLEIGRAYPTSAGHLSERGVLHIIHAIITNGLGEQPKRLSIPEALDEAMERIVELRTRTVALPILGVSATADTEARLDGAQVVIDSLVGALRIRKHRIERGILVSHFEDDRAPLEALLVRARERLWTE